MSEIIVFTPNTKARSQEVNDNFAGLANGTLDTVANSLERTRLMTLPDFIYSGITMPTSTNLSTTIATGTAIVQGKYVTPLTTVKTFNASKDTYVDLKTDGSYAYVEVDNGATTGMTLTPNAMRVAAVVTDSDNITNVFTTGQDPLGNSIGNLVPYLGGQPVIDYLETQDSTTSATPVTLGTVGPTVRINIGRSGMAMVFISANTFQSTANQWNYMFLTATGANTIDAQARYSYSIKSASGSADVRATFSTLLTGLNPGLTQFRAMYSVSGGEGYWRYRELVIIPL